MTIDLRKIHPLAAAYELTPGSIYIVQLGRREASSQTMEMLGAELSRLGVKGVVVVGDTALEIFRLETTSGAALAVQCGMPITGDEFCRKPVNHDGDCGGYEGPLEG